jgi:hypothetical protein
MVVINFPSFTPQLKTAQDKQQIFDPFRKKWVPFTPEEWVRQNFLHYLVLEKKYPESLIAVEKELLLNGQKKRFDILVYDRNLQPWMVIECKSMTTSLADEVLQQALQYNIVLQCQYLVVTNGSFTAAYAIATGNFLALTQLPDFV